MLIASRYDGKIPANPDYIKRVAYLKKKPNYKPLLLCGFLEDASGCKQMQADARPEERQRREEEEERQRQTRVREEAFESFWGNYPKKVGKEAARKAWVKILAPKGTLLDIIAALEWQTDSEQWKTENGRFIPNPATYLNRHSWKDEPPRDLNDERAQRWVDG